MRTRSVPTVASLSLGSPSYMRFRLKGKYAKKLGKNPNDMSIRIPLRHGDLMVMHGADIHKFYEVWLKSYDAVHERS